MDATRASRLRRLPLFALEGVWSAQPLDEDAQPDAMYSADVDAHFLRWSSHAGLHTVSVVNADPDEAEVDLWSANLDLDEFGKVITFPFWDIEQMIEHGGQPPIEMASHPDTKTLVVTVWNRHDHNTPRKFRLTR